MRQEERIVPKKSSRFRTRARRARPTAADCRRLASHSWNSAPTSTVSEYSARRKSADWQGVPTVVENRQMTKIIRNIKYSK